MSAEDAGGSGDVDCGDLLGTTDTISLQRLQPNPESSGEATSMAFATKMKGHHHLQGNVQVYDVGMPVEPLTSVLSHRRLELVEKADPSICTGCELHEHFNFQRGWT